VRDHLHQLAHNNTAELAWGVIGAGVLAYEWLAPEDQLLSHAADRAIEKHPVITTAAIGAVALHLANFIPYEADIIAIAGKRLNRYKRRQAAGEMS
jgi:hypothetical protein